MKLKNILASICLLVLSHTASAGLITETLKIEVLDSFSFKYWNINVGDTFSMDVSYNTDGFTTDSSGIYGGFTPVTTLSSTLLFENLVNNTALLNDGYFLSTHIEPDTYVSWDFRPSEDAYTEHFGISDFGVQLSLTEDHYGPIGTTFEGSFYISYSPLVGVGGGEEQISLSFTRSPMTQVPEPSSLAILGLGLLGLVRFRKKA